MADSKISNLTAATLVNSTDVVPAVVGGETLKVPFSLIMPAVTGAMKFYGADSTIDSGVINLTSFLSKVVSNATLAAGVPTQMKFISASADCIVTTNDGNLFSTLTFTAGQTALLYFDDKWYVMAASCVIG